MGHECTLSDCQVNEDPYLFLALQSEKQEVTNIPGFGKAWILKVRDSSIPINKKAMCAINSMTRHGPTNAIELNIPCFRCGNKVSLVPVD